MSCEPSAAVKWKTSSASQGTNCVEVAFADGHVLVRDSKNREAGFLAIPNASWRALIEDLGQDHYSS